MTIGSSRKDHSNPICTVEERNNSAERKIAGEKREYVLDVRRQQEPADFNNRNDKSGYLL